mmetsp:Transcript_5773/g.8202  ORF Transcript_5773/g.8202 Transcript_5773/m.8202 type:complete len:251 (-) Transcript_5773:1037-1789(-)
MHELLVHEFDIGIWWFVLLLWGRCCVRKTRSGRRNRRRADRITVTQALVSLFPSLRVVLQSTSKGSNACRQANAIRLGGFVHKQALLGFLIKTPLQHFWLVLEDCWVCVVQRRVGVAVWRNNEDYVPLILGLSLWRYVLPVRQQTLFLKGSLEYLWLVFKHPRIRVVNWRCFAAIGSLSCGGTHDEQKFFFVGICRLCFEVNQFRLSLVLSRCKGLAKHWRIHKVIHVKLTKSSDTLLIVTRTLAILNFE